jgi:hypothetical protein
MTAHAAGVAPSQGVQHRSVRKYMNSYEDAALNRQYIPPGWDEWFAFAESQYYDYHVNDNGTLEYYGKKPKDYSTDVLANKASSYIRNTDGPLMVFFDQPRRTRRRRPVPGRERVREPAEVGSAELQRAERLGQAEVAPGGQADGSRRGARRRAVPARPVRNADLPRPRGRSADVGAPGDRPARQHLHHLSLRQRHRVGRAPLAHEAGALRGEHPRPFIIGTTRSRRTRGRTPISS